LSTKRQSDAEGCTRRGTKSGNLWPIQGGSRCATTWEALKEYQQKGSGFKYSYTDTALKMWQHVSNQTAIINMHESDESITSSFVCNVLPRAPKTCKVVRGQTEETVENALSGEVGLLDVIAVAAADKGILDVNKISRITAVKQLQKVKVPKHILGLLPHKCPEESELSNLLLKSLKLEQRIVGNNGTEESLRNGFEKLVKKLAFCHLDMDKWLRNYESWDQVLTGLQNVSSDPQK
jgi:hypothetical protein